MSQKVEGKTISKQDRTLTFEHRSRKIKTERSYEPRGICKYLETSKNKQLEKQTKQMVRRSTKKLPILFCKPKKTTYEQNKGRM